jgi:hypothetical protein
VAPLALLRLLALPLLASLALPAVALAEEPGAPGREDAYRLGLRADMGFLGVLSHTLHKGRSGSTLDYRNEAGQDVLFPVSRMAVSLELAQRHRLLALYQPLELRTRETSTRDLVVDGTTFEAGTPLRFLYGFPFYRFGYDYAAWRTPSTVLRLGGAVQIRNATIEIEADDGSQLVSLRDVGVVPLLRAGLRQQLSERCWLELEADGIYAPIRYLNGNDNGVEGALLDANVALGIAAHEHFDAFINARYLGGGAQGSSDGSDEEHTSNWLSFLIFSAGIAVH